METVGAETSKKLKELQLDAEWLGLAESAVPVFKGKSQGHWWKKMPLPLDWCGADTTWCFKHRDESRIIPRLWESVTREGQNLTPSSLQASACRTAGNMLVPWPWLYWLHLQQHKCSLISCGLFWASWIVLWVVEACFGSTESSWVLGLWSRTRQVSGSFGVNKLPPEKSLAQA